MDGLLRACVTSVTRPLTRSSVELRPPSRQGPAFGMAFGRIVETTQGRPWDLEGTPSPGLQGLWTGARGSQGPSGRPATRGTPPDPRIWDYSGEGVDGFLRERHLTSGDLLRCRRALVRLERGAVRSPSCKLKFPYPDRKKEKGVNICELGELAKSAHGCWIGPQSIGLPRLTCSPALVQHCSI